ncbi:MAG: helix-turn-helix domain-containing protein [Nannocystaceae bacterium]
MARRSETSKPAAPGKAAASTGPGPARTRRRRRPEEAREAILSAADRLLVAHGPEAVGLAAVAREVGVSHGLVTHYFGTFAGLVREVFVRRNRVAAATVLEQVIVARERQDLDDLARYVIDFVTDEVRARLFLWLRFNDPGGTFGQGANLLRALVDAIERELPLLGERDRPRISREALEDVVLLTLAAGHGYAIGKRPWLRALGREDEAAADEAFRRALLRAIQRMVEPDP